MKEHDLREALKIVADGCQLSEYQKRQMIAHMKGEEPVKKKLTVSLALVMVITLLTLSVAVALVHSTIVDHLYGSSENAPKEVTERIQTPQATAETAFGTLSLEEWFYDGQALHTAFSISNPTSEPLFYTLDRIDLNGAHVSYNRLRTEGAGDSGFLLGGTVDGTSMPASISLYNQGDELYQYDENNEYTGRVPLPEGASTLKISVAVWRPVNTVELIDYDQYEGVNISEVKDHLTVDNKGYGQLWLFRPEKYNLNYEANQSGAQVYKDVYKELGWMELLDTIEVETTIHLSKEQAVRAIPEFMEYGNGNYRLVLEQFDFSHAGGKLSARICGNNEAVNSLVTPYGLSLVDKEGGRILNNGCFWDDQSNEVNGLHVSMHLIPSIGELPEVVYIAPATSYNECMDPVSPLFDPNVGKPENVIEGWTYDFTRAIELRLKTIP